MFPADVPTVRVSGDSYQVGYQHGQSAKEQIHAVLATYKDYFETVGAVYWQGVQACATKFARAIERDHKDLFDEMKGIADGSGEELLDIVALNTRSEIALTSREELPVDGCTSLAWQGQDGKQWIGQNWDWKEWAHPNMIILDIAPDAASKRPHIKFLSEAGQVGKIGLNEHGVAVMLNALRTGYLSYDHIPVHLALRRLLEAPSMSAGLEYLSKTCGGRAASAAHILVADATGAASLELSPSGNTMEQPSDGLILHTNHILWRPDPSEILLWPDSLPRLDALEKQTARAVAAGDEPGYETFRRILSDRSGGKPSICRFEDKEGIVTVFSIAVECAARRAEVKLGRPDEGGALVVLDFKESV